MSVGSTQREIPLRQQMARPLKIQNWREAVAAWMLAGPAFLLIAILSFVPVLAVIAISFTSWQFGADSFAFIGLGNFEEVLRTPGSAPRRSIPRFMCSSWCRAQFCSASLSRC